MAQKFKNFARSTLQGSLTNVATSLTVNPAECDRFPVANTTDWFYAAVIDSAGNYELMRVDTRAGGASVLSGITRAQGGTSALAFAAGSLVLHGPTAGDLENILAGIFASQFVCSGKAYTVPVEVSPVAGVLTIDASLSNVFNVTPALAANITSVVINNASDGQTIDVRYQQDGTGGRSVVNPTGAKITGGIETGVNRVTHWIATYVGTITTIGAVDRWEGNWAPIPA